MTTSSSSSRGPRHQARPRRKEESERGAKAVKGNLHESLLIHVITPIPSTTTTNMKLDQSFTPQLSLSDTTPLIGSVAEGDEGNGGLKTQDG